MAQSILDRDTARPTLALKVLGINWGLLLLLVCIAGIGFAMLYSAANGHWEPWASKQAVRFAVSVGITIFVATVDLRFWLRAAYAIYIGVMLLLVAVEIRGAVGMGAQRWIDLGVIQLQPSEMMKIALVLALARYFSNLSVEEIGRPVRLIIPALLVLLPAGLVLKQPDLGTAMMLVLSGGAIFFLAGVRWWKFVLVMLGAGGAAPVAWRFMRDYQRNRILNFLNPENDPLGAGYHSLQSKIAIGSGGLFGKGFMMGSQAHLDFLPERQTDMIFTMLAEEFGLVGCVVVLGLYLLVFIYGFAIAFRSRSHFGRLLALGLTINVFLYVFINAGMVTGLLPIVGVPLPLISYGGTSMLT
ncbi:MAG TPA: rod shape-determining protein RodA, partial [Stellaceae bacterium]|nr:rod shape-determining protein RodA [Stellaceae bacterium]